MVWPIVGVVFGIAVILLGIKRDWWYYYKMGPKPEETLGPIPVPEILHQHEHPQSTAHFETGPHINCPCRVCDLQTKILHLELELDRAKKLVGLVRKEDWEKQNRSTR